MSFYPQQQNPFMAQLFPQMSQPQQNIPSINSVNCKASVENYFIPPNGSDMFLDEVNKKFYTKRVDAGGSAVVESFSYTKDKEKKPVEYVTKAEFEAFKSKMKGGRHESNTSDVDRK